MQSPTSTMDIIQVQGLEQAIEMEPKKEARRFICKRRALFPVEFERSLSPLPPLDQVTVGSSSVDDGSDGSVSSISTNGDVDEKPRSIFQAYWVNNPEARDAGSSSRAAKVLPPRQPGDDSSSAANSYERALRQKECLSPRSRRRIFAGCWSESAPSLPLHSGLRYDSSFRKAKSASMLTGRPLRSCLRQSRFSGKSCDQLPIDSSQRSSVSFSNRVDTHIIERPAEQWAADGWSKMFA